MQDALKIEFMWRPNGVGLEMPRQHTAGAAGLDLPAALEPDQLVCIEPGRRAIIPCGFSLGLPLGFEAQIRPRSGLAARHGVTVLNTPGTIDADYRGEIMVILINLGDTDFEVRRGDRIAQMIVAPVTSVSLHLTDTLDHTLRGEKGHGSTGYQARP